MFDKILTWEKKTFLCPNYLSTKKLLFSPHLKQIISTYILTLKQKYPYNVTYSTNRFGHMKFSCGVQAKYKIIKYLIISIKNTSSVVFLSILLTMS